MVLDFCETEAVLRTFFVLGERRHSQQFARQEGQFGEDARLLGCRFLPWGWDSGQRAQKSNRSLRETLPSQSTNVVSAKPSS